MRMPILTPRCFDGVRMGITQRSGLDKLRVKTGVPDYCTNYCTTNSWLLVSVPLAVTTEIFPLVAPTGTVAEI